MVSNGTFKSWSQKYLASDRRARSTRSLPATTASGCTASMFETNANDGAISPLACFRPKYF